MRFRDTKKNEQLKKKKSSLHAIFQNLRGNAESFQSHGRPSEALALLCIFLLGIHQHSEKTMPVTGCPKNREAIDEGSIISWLSEGRHCVLKPFLQERLLDSKWFCVLCFLLLLRKKEEKKKEKKKGSRFE